MNIQRTLLAKFLQDKNSDELMHLDNAKFTGEHLRILNFVHDYISDNSGKVPTIKIMRRHFGAFAADIKAKISEPVHYLKEQLDDAHAHNSLVDMVTDITKKLKLKGEIRPTDVLKEAEKQLLTIRTEVTSERQKAQDITKRGDSIKDRLEERRKKGGIIGYHLPFPSLTKHLRGARKKRLYTLIARTSVGKTVLTFLVALHIWRQYDVPIVFLSGELDYEQMEDMFLSFISGLPIHKIENGDLTDKEMIELQKKLAEIRDKKAPFVFGFAGTFADVVTEVNTHAPSALFVDSFYELDRFNEPDDTKRTAVVVSRLQRMSREYDIPVFINSQANRATDKKKGADLSNISFSDTIGQTSDAVITMNQSEDMKAAREMEIALLKNRGGRLCKVLCNWNFDENDFSEIRELDEFGEAQDTSDLTNEEVEQKSEAGKYDKLFGRKQKIPKKEDKGGTKRIIKKKPAAVEEEKAKPKKRIMKKVAA